MREASLGLSTPSTRNIKTKMEKCNGDEECISRNVDILLISQCFPFISQFTNFTIGRMLSTNNNTSNSSYHMIMQTRKQFGDVWNPIINILLCFIIVTINWMMIFGIWKTRKKFNFSTKLFILWSIFDLINGAAMIPMALLELTIGFSSNFCSIFAGTLFMISLTNGCSASTFILISILRNLSIRKPLQELRIRRVVTVLVVSLSIVLAKSAINFLAYSRTHTSFGLLFGYWILVPAWLLLQVILLVSFNTFSQISLTKISRTQTVRVVSQADTKISYQRKAVNTLLLISSVYGFCYVTTACYYVYCVYKLWNLRDDPHGFAEIKLTFVSFHVPMLLGSALNSLIYILKNTKIKKYYRNLCQFHNRIETSSSDTL